MFHVKHPLLAKYNLFHVKHLVDYISLQYFTLVLYKFDSIGF